ncbi:MAG: hypothetical protein LBQ19_01560 [Synergistaceae bacterium]|jgi:hypothetical protein|nr:hypothetical protein [Synergistaceae bacterium]
MTQFNAEVKKDMLSIHSTVQEILRALYFYGADYIMVQLGSRERLLHKDQLIALLEQGRSAATLEDMFIVTLTEPLAAKMNMEDVPQGQPLLVFAEGSLECSTFESYRERRIMEAMVLLPAWWGVPLPLLNIKNDRASLNDAALQLIPGGMKALADQIGKIRSDGIIVVKEKKKERTFSLLPLEDETYFIEEISGDFEMAEDLLWWASIGSAFVRRMEENGLSVRRISPFGTAPENAAEVIPCSWEGELIGRLVIELPKEDETEISGAPPESAKETKRRAPRNALNASAKSAREEEAAPCGETEPARGGNAASDNQEAPAPSPKDRQKNKAGRSPKPRKALSRPPSDPGGASI